MVKVETIKPVLLLACIGIIAIALVGPVAGHNMGQSTTGQKGMMVVCPDNQTCMMMQSSMGDHQANKTMICCVTGEHLANGSCYMVKMDRNASTIQARLNCADFWLEKAIKLHKLHMEDPSTTTNESQMEMMDQMMHAHECITGENVTMEMMNNTTACSTSAGYEQVFICAAQARLNCADFWLEKAIKLHEMHLKDPSTATDESQMEMMEQMMHAHECITGESAAMQMTAQAKLDCVRYHLQQAIELHEMHMEDPSTETNESKMEMMHHVVEAYKCVSEENMTMKMMNATLDYYDSDNKSARY